MDGIAFGREDVMRRLRLFDDAVDDMFDGARRFEIVLSILDDPCEVAANLDAETWKNLGEHWNQIRQEEGNDGADIDIPSLDSQTDGLSFRPWDDGHETLGGRGAR